MYERSTAGEELIDQHMTRFERVARCLPGFVKEVMGTAWDIRYDLNGGGDLYAPTTSHDPHNPFVK